MEIMSCSLQILDKEKQLREAEVKSVHDKVRREGGKRKWERKEVFRKQ